MNRSLWKHFLQISILVANSQRQFHSNHPCDNIYMGQPFFVVTPIKFCIWFIYIYKIIIIIIYKLPFYIVQKSNNFNISCYNVFALL